MSSANSSNSNNNSDNHGQGQPQSQPHQESGHTISLHPKQLLDLSVKFKQLVQEAKNVGEHTQKGKELLIQASKLKAVYEAYARQRQEAIQAYQARLNACNTNNSNNNASEANVGNIQAKPNQVSAGNQLANAMRQVLTPEQNQQYDKLVKNFRLRASQIKEKHTFLKQNIDRLTQEIEKQADPETKQRLDSKRNELLLSLKALSGELNTLHKQFQNGKKVFYIECARHNPDLQRLLQRSTRRLAHQEQQQRRTETTAAVAPGLNQLNSPPSNEADMVQSQSQAQFQQQQQQHMLQQQQQQQAQLPAANSTSAPAQAPTQPAGSPDASNTNAPTSSAAVANNSAPAAPAAATTSTNTDTSNTTGTTGTTGPAATATPTGTSTVYTKQQVFKQADPSVPVPDTISTKPPQPIPLKSNRPTITGGSAMRAASLNTPALLKLPPYEIDTERVMSKRKLRELVKSIGIDEGDGETVIDGDVEELLLDLADDFVTNVTSFACRLAKHRRSDVLEPKDIQLHLERNWNIRIPGYAADEIRSIRKWYPSQSYTQRLQSISASRSSNANGSSGSGGGGGSGSGSGKVTK